MQHVYKNLFTGGLTQIDNLTRIRVDRPKVIRLGGSFHPYTPPLQNNG